MENGTISATEVSGLATVATSGSYTDLSATPTLATVATSGSYNDLTSKPPTLTSGTAITTNGAASYSFTDIPASAKNIRLMFRDVSTSTNAGIQLKIGTSGGIVTSGYTGNILTVDSTTVSQSGALSDAFILTTIGSTLLFSGIIELAEIQSNIWVHRSQLGAGGTRSHLSVGQLSLGAELTTLQILVGVGTFDGGTINVLYE